MPDTWKPIGPIVAKLRAKCEAAMRDGNFEIAETYDRLATDAEIQEHLNKNENKGGEK